MKIGHGNLWDWWEKGWYIGISTNCVVTSWGLVMGAGLALQAKQRWPELPRQWAAMKPVIEVMLDDGKRLVRCPTKAHWNDLTPIWLVENTIIELLVMLEEKKGLQVALPPLGCSLGGRDWESEVWPLMRGLPDNVTVILRQGDTNPC